jgi:hypothetical protein
MFGMPIKAESPFMEGTSYRFIPMAYRIEPDETPNGRQTNPPVAVAW